jgi:hypothetical protein
MSGFVVLSHGGNQRRIPFWFRVERPRLRFERHLPVARAGTYRGNTARGVARVSSYRYPDVRAGHVSFPVRLVGREVVYRLQLRRRVANLGVTVTSLDRGVRVEPRIVRAGDENRLAGYSALPYDQNPYRGSYGAHRLVAGVLLPAPGVYDVVFDTPRNARAGGFRFRFWLGDVQPPTLRLRGVRGGFLEVTVSDRGSGLDPASLQVQVDGRAERVTYAAGVARVPIQALSAGRHALSFTASDYQETKNTEDIAGILPNTRTLRTTFVR